ncbi:uncharacterized protein LOC115788463 [Archocentrus centrarchus]|uniref:uncharacterized protein LOC115788463 n=1 Tax=Archocentrus centrarchus TaxID=63155 RepID=UPI0011E9D83A|nr:uncharacterized protein LOC115788463 [Archocentrus centrarchus]
MDGLHIIRLVLFGVFSCCQSVISESTLEVTAQPGDNITLYCDCKLTIGVYIIWYRNCSHENTLVLRHKSVSSDAIKPFSHFHFVRNDSSNSRDLMILNVTDSDEGLYYCGTEEQHEGDKEVIPAMYIYTYGNSTTRIKLGKPSISQEKIIVSVTRVSWMVVLTPAFTILSSLFSFILVYHVCQKTEKGSQDHQKRLSIKRRWKQNMDEDLCLTRVVFLPQDGQTHQSEDKHITTPVLNLEL